jgi:hypothetical protein
MAENSSTSSGLTPNTTGSEIVPEVEQIIVVDFRQWYQHGFEYVNKGYAVKCPQRDNKESVTFNCCKINH